MRGALTSPPRAKRQIVTIITSVKSALSLRSFITIPAAEPGAAVKAIKGCVGNNGRMDAVLAGRQRSYRLC